MTRGPKFDNNTGTRRGKSNKELQEELGMASVENRVRSKRGRWKKDLETLEMYDRRRHDPGEVEGSSDGGENSCRVVEAQKKKKKNRTICK